MVSDSRTGRSEVSPKKVYGTVQVDGILDIWS